MAGLGGRNFGGNFQERAMRLWWQAVNQGGTEFNKKAHMEGHLEPKGANARQNNTGQPPERPPKPLRQRRSRVRALCKGFLVPSASCNSDFRTFHADVMT
jgi:hypothetical protein